MSDDQSESAALCFRSAQDAIDYVDHCCQDAARLLAANDVDGLDGYVKGKLYIACQANFGRCGHQYDFLFFRVPPVSGVIDAAVTGVGSCRETHSKAPDADWNKGAVFLGITELVQGPEGVIPSFVWLEPSKQRQDFRWQVLASSASYDVFKSGEIVPKGKLSLLGVNSATRDGGGEAALIEGSSEVVCCIEEDARKLFREGFSESVLMDVLGPVIIRLNDVGPWVLMDKSVDPGIEIVDVVMCATQGELGAREKVCHGQQTLRSDERP